MRNYYRDGKSGISMSQITTHILDTSRGKPGEEITVILSQQQAEGWKQLALGSTDSQGRNTDLLNDDTKLELGVYRLRFETREYFEKLGVLSFYPFVEITFNVTSDEHYHIPVLISPYGFTTYRGT